MHCDKGAGCNKSKPEGFEIHELNLWSMTMWLWDRKGPPRIIGMQRELGAMRVHTIFETNELSREDKER